MSRLRLFVAQFPSLLLQVISPALASHRKDSSGPCWWLIGKSVWPLGMHVVICADPERGLPPGVIFELRNRHAGVHVQQLNRLHPYYLV